ncbi:hypothetical protein ABK040_014693 [Willaertia magna]
MKSVIKSFITKRFYSSSLKNGQLPVNDFSMKVLQTVKSNPKLESFFRIKELEKEEGSLQVHGDGNITLENQVGFNKYVRLITDASKNNEPKVIVESSLRHPFGEEEKDQERLTFRANENLEVEIEKLVDRAVDFITPPPQ